MIKENWVKEDNHQTHHEKAEKLAKHHPFIYLVSDPRSRPLEGAD